MTHFTSIPTIDISPLFSTDTAAKERLKQEFFTAYSETGFGYIINHGIDPAVRQAVFDASARFHALPLNKKMPIELNALHRGYMPINTSTDINSKLAKVTKPNQSASFMMLREDSAPVQETYLSGPNQWPILPGFRTSLERYHTAMADLGHRLLELAIQSFGGDPAEVASHFAPPTTWLRLLHYPPRPEAAEDLYGSAPHCDFGCLTLLAQDDVGGLQVQTPAGAWVDAPVIPDSFIVNVGDMLHKMSNGRLRSTPHRVINRSGKERYSVPFFYDPHVSATIRPMQGTGKPRFKPLNFGDFLRGELQAGYDRHKNPTV